MGTLGARPVIAYDGKEVLHCGMPCRVVMRKGIVSVGCSDVTIEALRYLLSEYDKHFPELKEIVLQP